MYRITIEGETETARAMADLLEHVAGQLRNDMTSGYYPHWSLETVEPRTAIVVTVGERRYVVVEGAERLFEGVPDGRYASRQRPQRSAAYDTDESTWGKFSFGARWLRSLGKVDESYRTLSSEKVTKVERLPHAKVWGWLP